MKKPTIPEVLLACGELNKRELAAVRWVLDRWPRWVPVEEGLPEPDTKVLVIVRMTFHEVEITRTEVLFAKNGYDFKGNRDWKVYQERSIYLGDEVVTHWMPLPEPPKP